VELCGRGLI